jgi:hypothetical protein
MRSVIFQGLFIGWTLLALLGLVIGFLVIINQATEDLVRVDKPVGRHASPGVRTSPETGDELVNVTFIRIVAACFWIGAFWLIIALPLGITALVTLERKRGDPDAIELASHRPAPKPPEAIPVTLQEPPPMPR